LLALSVVCDRRQAYGGKAGFQIVDSLDEPRTPARLDKIPLLNVHFLLARPISTKRLDAAQATPDCLDFRLGLQTANFSPKAPFNANSFSASFQLVDQETNFRSGLRGFSNETCDFKSMIDVDPVQNVFAFREHMPTRRCIGSTKNRDPRLLAITLGSGKTCSQ
jgi:hypothetical protein